MLIAKQYQICSYLVLLFSYHLFQLLGELLHEGQAISIGVSCESGQGGQWLAYIAHLVKESSVNDVTVVPVGISYDSAPNTSMQVGVKMDLCKHTLQEEEKVDWVYSEVSSQCMEKLISSHHLYAVLVFSACFHKADGSEISLAITMPIQFL